MDVSLNINSKVSYPKTTPFHPDRIYPELKYLGVIDIDKENKVFSSVRTLLEDLKLDKDNIGTSQWNPFSDFIKPGNNVVIKPNLVLHHNNRKKDISAVVTHGSVIRPIIDYALLALKDSGTLVVGDAPHGDADFDAIVKFNGLYDLIKWYKKRGINIELRDFRKYVYPKGFDVSICQELKGDPKGYTLVDLKEKSKLNTLSNIERLYGSDYNRDFIVRQHLNGNHKYLISGTILNSDVIISVPKLKTHKKTGITINLKNLVGINGDKNYLAHYRIGSPSFGGDEYPDTHNIILKLLRAYNIFSRDKLLAPNKLSLRYVNRIIRIPFLILNKLYRMFSNNRVISGGNWFGNDTTWRMCLDLNYILRFSDNKGVLHDAPQRKYFCVVDGIVGGEGNGPMEPDPVKAGILLSGYDPYKTDYVSTFIMGLKPSKIKLINESINDKFVGFTPKDLRVSARRNGSIIDYKKLNFKFKPHEEWIGEIERTI